MLPLCTLRPCSQAAARIAPSTLCTEILRRMIIALPEANRWARPGTTPLIGALRSGLASSNSFDFLLPALPKADCLSANDANE